MISRNQIESILKINGVEPTSPDELIRSVLLSARYDENEVNSALMVLRQNIVTNQTRVDGLHKVFRTNQALCPQEISQLLGIEVNIQENIVAKPQTTSMSNRNIISGIILAFLLAVIIVMIHMYLAGIGVFHPSAY
jgi:hypothetical protein